MGAKHRLPTDATAAEWRLCARDVVDAQRSKERYFVLWAVDRGEIWIAHGSQALDFSLLPRRSLNLPVSQYSVGDRVFLLTANLERRLLGMLPTSYEGRSHANMSASVMAGHAFIGSHADGVAPAAQLAVFQHPQGRDEPSLEPIEATFAAFRHPAVHVVQASYAASDTSHAGMKSVFPIWLDRLARDTGKPFAKAIGNYGARSDGVSEFNLSGEAFSVGAYTARESWQAHFGIDPPVQHTLPSYSGYGPAGDGGLKPDFLALTHTLAEGGDPSFMWKPPVGYETIQLSAGTSAAAPHAAGHLALLISAARQTGVPHDRIRLRAAIATSARFLQGVEARAQGHGLIQVADAWAALQRAKDWAPSEFITRAPVVGAEAGPTGPQRWVGRGLFERSGWRPGQSGQRELSVTRVAGPAAAVRYRLRWKGQGSAFRSALTEVELPLNRPATIPVEIRVGAAGAYSAVLDLMDPAVELVAHSVMLTVIAAEPLTSARGSTVTLTRQALRPGNASFYVNVPPGLSALTVKLTHDVGPAKWRAQDPTGRVMPYIAYGSVLARRYEARTEAREQPFVYTDPVPGVWQFWMQYFEPSSREDLLMGDWNRLAQVRAEVRGWRFGTGDWKEVSAQHAATAGFNNRLERAHARIEPIGLGAARLTETSLKPGWEPALFELTVIDGTLSLEVECEVDEPDAQVGLYVYQVPDEQRPDTALRTGSGVTPTALIYQDSSRQLRKRYRLRDPPPGRYVVALDPLRVQGREVRVRYRDVLYHHAFGSVAAEDEFGALETGRTKSARVMFHIRTRPADRRHLVAAVGLFAAPGEVGAFAESAAEREPVATQVFLLERFSQE